MKSLGSTLKKSREQMKLTLKEVEKALGSDLGTALEANLISQAAFEAAKQDDYEAFLHERAKTIAAEVSKLTGWPPS